MCHMADQHLETTALERLSYGGFFFGQILGRMTRLCYKFSSMLGYEIVSNSHDTAAILHER